MRDLALGPVVSWVLLVGGFSLGFRTDGISGFAWGVLGLTLGEVGGSRSLRGGMGRCRGLGRTFSDDFESDGDDRV